MKDLDHSYFKVHTTITDNNYSLEFSVLQIRKIKADCNSKSIDIQSNYMWLQMITENGDKNLMKQNTNRNPNPKVTRTLLDQPVKFINRV